MGEGDPSEGEGDCSQAPLYCFEQGVISNLVSVLQPERPVPIIFWLKSSESGTVVRFEPDYRVSDDADLLLTYFYNSGGLEPFYLSSLPLVDGYLELSIPYQNGAFDLSGNLGESEGSGNFSVYHPDIGEFVSGSWSVTCQE
jgi:hypothetical protein